MSLQSSISSIAASIKKTSESQRSNTDSIWHSMNPFGLLQEMSKVTLREFLTNFYIERGMEGKLKDIDALIIRYEGQENKLFMDLDKSYNTNYAANPPLIIPEAKQQTSASIQAPNKAKTKSSVNKVILLGNSGVGKTNLLSRLNTGEFSDAFSSTIGVEFLTHVMNVDGVDVKAQIWDTAGQERFHAMMSTYYRKAVGAALVYDIGDSKSLASIEGWLDQLLNVADSGIQTILIGNKCDLDSKHQRVKREEAQAFAAKHNMLFMETSAKSGHNVEPAFRMLLSAIHRSRMEREEGDLATIDLSASNNSMNQECCT